MPGVRKVRCWASRAWRRSRACDWAAGTPRLGRRGDDPCGLWRGVRMETSRGHAAALVQAWASSLGLSAAHNSYAAPVGSGLQWGLFES